MPKLVLGAVRKCWIPEILPLRESLTQCHTNIRHLGTSTLQKHFLFTKVLNTGLKQLHNLQSPVQIGNPGPLVQNTVKNFKVAAAEQETLRDSRGPPPPTALALNAGSYIKGASSP